MDCRHENRLLGRRTCISSLPYKFRTDRDRDIPDVKRDYVEKNWILNKKNKLLTR